MTVTERNLRRRSQRAGVAVAQSSQYTTDLSDIDAVAEDAVAASSAEDDASDEEYGKPHRKRKAKLSKGNGKRRKHQRSKLPTTADEVDDFVENVYFQALSDPDISIQELAAGWLDDYMTNSAGAIKDLLNLVLRCCGCVLQVEEHDVANADSAPDTIGEVQQVFADQAVHEYPLLTTNSKWKNFRNNVMEFFAQVLLVSDEKEILCSEEQGLMEDILTWLSPLSTSSTRPLRFAATLVLLHMETELCELVVKSCRSLEKYQHQSDLENKKIQECRDKLGKTTAAREANKLEKDIQKIDKRLEQITKNVDMANNQKSALEEFLKDISNSTFVHRYRDIDPRIRQECMSSLGQWIDVYPDMFFDSTYLRYFGWMLSDKDASVRLEVVKSLAKLYRKPSIIPGFRQFTERFKKRLVEMAIYDSDYNIRASVLPLLAEIIRIGYMEEEEILDITSLIYCAQNSKVNLVCNTENKFHKTHHELAKIVNIVENDATKDFVEKNKASIAVSAEALTLDFGEMLKYKNLYAVLQKSHDRYLEEYSGLEKSETPDDGSKHIDAFKFLYLLPSYSTPQLLDFLLRYLTFDFSSATLVDTDIKRKVEVTSPERYLILCHMAAIASLHLSESDQPAFVRNMMRSHLSKKTTDDASVSAEKDVVASKLTTNMPKLFAMFKNSDASLAVLVKIHKMLLVDSRDSQLSAHQAPLLQVSERIAETFKESEIDSDQSLSYFTFKQFFGCLSYETDTQLAAPGEQANRLLLTKITAETVAELVHNLKEAVNTDDYSMVDSVLLKICVLGETGNIVKAMESTDDTQSEESVIVFLCHCFGDFASKDPKAYLPVLRLLSAYVSKKLETILSDKDHVLTDSTFSISNSLQHLEEIFRFVRNVLDDKDSPQLQKEYQLFWMDLVMSLKGFQLKLAEKLTGLESADKLADLNAFFDFQVPLDVDAQGQQWLMREFLEREQALAGKLDVQLDRLEQEDVAFGDVGGAGEADGDDDARTKARVEAENDLCVMAYKLVSMANLGMLPQSVVKRLRLNAELLGSKLFSTIVGTDAPPVEEPRPEAEGGPTDVVEPAAAIEQAEDVDMEL